ncbi:MAG: endonuclease domain-containing protein [Eubacteriales bacterium]
MQEQYKHNRILTPTARELRKNMTPQEKQLWYHFLNKYPVRILKQKVINSFIADFYCAKAMLVIELDGSQHYMDEGLAYDEARTETINAYGIDVIRFSNSEVDENFAGVCEAIDIAIKQRTAM